LAGVEEVHQIHIRDTGERELAGQAITTTLQADGQRGGASARQHGQLMGSAVLIVLDHTLQRGEVDVQVRTAEEVVALPNLLAPGRARKGIGRWISMTGTTKLVNLLGSRLGRERW